MDVVSPEWRLIIVEIIVGYLTKLISCGGRETSCEGICSRESVPLALSQLRSHMHILHEWLIVMFA